MVFKVDPADRLQFVPPHRGPNVLPSFMLFTRMIRHAHKKKLVAIKDLTFEYEASYAQVLTDVCHMRNILLQTLDPETVRKLENDEEVFINLLATPGYEFTIGFLSLMAVGAGVSPLSPDWPVKEAANLVKRGGSVSVLVTERCAQKGRDLARLVSLDFESKYQCVDIKPHVMQPCLAPEGIHISSDLYLDINGSGLIIFTSGTTGPPKGAVRRRGFFTDGCLMTADQYGMQEGDTVLHQLPVHHITGIGFTLIPFLMMGGCIEFKTGGFDTAFTWERIRQGGLTYFSGVPTIYMRLMQYYEQNIANLPTEKKQPYLDGILNFKSLLCGTSALPAPLQEKWSELRNGQKILTRYGGTEFGSGFVVPSDAGDVPATSVGAVTPGVDLKLSNGDEGEILMKSPYMFSRYASDPEATKAAHDENGYFKTGDIARRKGRWYFIMGRASIDIIKSGGYKISALDVEREIMGLDYVNEVMVVPLEDEEFGERVAAAIVLRDRKQLTIDKLRYDLRTHLPNYQMPTVLRVVSDIPKNPTGKMMKKAIRPQIFPPEGHPDIQRWKRQNEYSKL